MFVTRVVDVTNLVHRIRFSGEDRAYVRYTYVALYRFFRLSRRRSNQVRVIYAQMQHYRALLDDARYHRLGALRDRFRFLSRDASAWLFRKLDNTDNSSLAPTVRT